MTDSPFFNIILYWTNKAIAQIEAEPYTEAIAGVVEDLYDRMGTQSDPDPDGDFYRTVLLCVGGSLKLDAFGMYVLLLIAIFEDDTKGIQTFDTEVDEVIAIGYPDYGSRLSEARAVLDSRRGEQT